MSLFLDVFILAVIVITIIGGYKRGFIRSVMNLASAALSFFASVFFTPYVADFLCGKVFLPRISSGIKETLTSLLGMNSDSVRSTEQLFSDMPDAFTSIIERFGVDLPAFIAEFSSPEAATELTVNAMSDKIALAVATSISAAVAFFALFVGFLIILSIITATLDACFELPVLKQLNSLAGLIFGVICSLFYAVIWSTLAISVVEVLGYIDPIGFSAEIIDKTVLVKLFSGIRLSLLAEVLVQL